MEIKGEQVKLKVSEAAWIFDKAPFNLRRKILEARLAFAEPYLPAETMHDIREGVRRADSKSKLLLLVGSLAIIWATEDKHGKNPDGTELHAIGLTMDAEEITWMRLTAQACQETARESLMDYAATLEEMQSVGDDLIFMSLVSDYMDAQRASELAGSIPSYKDSVGEDMFEEALHTLAVTSGIIQAIDASRNTP